jgi:hypothetical protein
MKIERMTFVCLDNVQRPSKIRTPAAIARMLKTRPRPLRAATNGMRPVKISQIANKIMPTLCVSRMLFISLSYATNSVNTPDSQ